MAQTGIVAITAGAFLSLLMLLHLIMTIGNPKGPQNFGFESLREGRADNTVFLLGAGKADITG
jgi:hypothetical protein